MLNYIQTTKTETENSLSVKAFLDTTVYKKGMKIKDKQMKELNIEYHKIIPKWNYTIRPTKM